MTTDQPQRTSTCVRDDRLICVTDHANDPKPVLTEEDLKPATHVAIDSVSREGG
jgi:hypothetical protein